MVVLGVLSIYHIISSLKFLFWVEEDFNYQLLNYAPFAIDQ